MVDLTRPTNLALKAFVADKYAWYERIREERPVHRIRISVMTLHAVSRYEDCETVLKDPRVVRNRTTATGGGRAPFPVPAALRALMESMIVEDDPNHRRLREFALPIPVRMISDIMGIDYKDMPEIQRRMNVLTSGFGGWRILKSLLWDLRDTARFVQDLIHRKRLHPGDDILTANSLSASAPSPHSCTRLWRRFSATEGRSMEPNPDTPHRTYRCTARSFPRAARSCRCWPLPITIHAHSIDHLNSTSPVSPTVIWGSAMACTSVSGRIWRAQKRDWQSAICSSGYPT